MRRSLPLEAYYEDARDEQMDLAATVKAAEDVAKGVADSELRKVAFELVLAHLLAAAGDREGKTASAGATPPRQVAVGAKPTSLREFVAEVDPKSGPECVAAIGYYLEKHEGLGGFRTGDMSRCLKELKRSFANPSQVVADAKKRAFLMESGESKKMLQLTNTAEKWVEERLKGAE